jgi:pentatricopeptide repeat domain-containing protein 1
MYGREGNCKKSEAILREMKVVGKKPDIVSYNIVINAYCKQGLMQGASRIFSEMMDSGIHPSIVTYNTFVAGYSNLAMFEEAMNVFNYMKKHGYMPNEHTYNAIVDSYCKLGRFQAASDFVNKIRQTDNTFDHEKLYRLSQRITEHKKQILLNQSLLLCTESHLWIAAIFRASNVVI